MQLTAIGLMTLATLLAAPKQSTPAGPVARHQQKAPPQEQEPSRLTTIEVEDMHCANCAKKIARKLFTVPGIVRVQTYLNENKAVITPQQDKDPAPLAMWEAVEKAGFKVVKLEGPDGKFTEKPKAETDTEARLPAPPAKPNLRR